MPKWTNIARDMIGTTEGAGAKNNPIVVTMFALSGHPEVKTDSTPWCAAFVGYCLKKAGLKNSGTLWALDYAGYGVKLDGPVVGAIACKKRRNASGKVIGGHVFFVVDYDEKRRIVWGLGGNQRDAVNIMRYAVSEIESFNWPDGVAIPKDPKTGAFRGKTEARGGEA